LTAKVLGTDYVTVCFFGDGASEQGTIHESMNLAGIWKLPVVFVCENNLYAESTPSSYHCSAGEICARAAGYDIPGSAIDGTDVFAVYEASGKAIDRARQGEGPSLIEARAFRYYGHFMGDPQVYKTENEFQSDKARDPLTRFRNRVLEHHLVSEIELTKIDDRVKEMIREAVRFAEKSPYPVPEECLEDVYVSYPREEVER
jgi:pyruvate dehydrogenase E1 component alpha subunit